MLCAYLLPGDVAHPGEHEVHEGVSTLEVGGFDLGGDFFFTLLEPGAVGGLFVVILLFFKFGFLLVFDLIVEGVDDGLEVCLQG